MGADRRDLRWDVRVAPGEDSLVRRAAAESSRSLSEFVRSAAVLEAKRVLADRTAFALDADRWARFVEALDRPPRVPAGLEELFASPSVFDSRMGWRASWTSAPRPGRASSSR